MSFLDDRSNSEDRADFFANVVQRTDTEQMLESMDSAINDLATEVQRFRVNVMSIYDRVQRGDFIGEDLCSGNNNIGKIIFTSKFKVRSAYSKLERRFDITATADGLSALNRDWKDLYNKVDNDRRALFPVLFDMLHIAAYIINGICFNLDNSGTDTWLYKRRYKRDAVNFEMVAFILNDILCCIFSEQIGVLSPSMSFLFSAIRTAFKDDIDKITPARILIRCTSLYCAIMEGLYEKILCELRDTPSGIAVVDQYIQERTAKPLSLEYCECVEDIGNIVYGLLGDTTEDFSELIDNFEDDGQMSRISVLRLKEIAKSVYIGTLFKRLAPTDESTQDRPEENK